MGLKVLPEHIQLLNGLTPHLGKKGRALADRVVNVLQLLPDQSSKGGLDSVLNLMSAAGSKSNNDLLQVVGQFMKNFNSRSQKGRSSDFGSSFFIVLILVLLLQDFK